MKNSNLTPMQERKRKMFLVLPVLVLPFITLAFYALGGGKDNSHQQEHPVNTGLNLQLPDATFKDDKSLTKMGYYDKAAYDSAKRAELAKNDPYYKIRPIAIDCTGVNVPDSNEKKALEKIAALDKVINAKATAATSHPGYDPDERTLTEADRLQDMMQDMQHTKTSPNDPDLQQLNSMLDKIMTIQHPDRVSEETRLNSEKQTARAFPVSIEERKDRVSLLVDERLFHSPVVADSGFFSIPKLQESDLMANAIEAVVHETRTLVNGSIVKFRLLTDIYINGILIPAGYFVFGKAALSGERLFIEIPSIRYKKSIYPVSLTVYDLDGMDGVFVPGAITRDVEKESSEKAIQGIALSSLDPSLGAQATSAGLEAAKSLLTKKVKLIKVVLKSGYKVLLKDKK